MQTIISEREICLSIFLLDKTGYFTIYILFDWRQSLTTFMYIILFLYIKIIIIYIIFRGSVKGTYAYVQ